MDKSYIKKGLIVSIQNYSQNTTQELAEKVINGEAIAIRTDQQISVNVPVIALEKIENEKYYITSTIGSIKKCMWGNYIAIDSRKGNRDLDLLYSFCHINEINIIADIENIEDVYNLLEICTKLKLKGIKYIATTFSFLKNGMPDISLIKKIKKVTKIPVIAEGKYNNDTFISLAIQNGASHICIGTVISDIEKITSKYKGLIDAFNSAAEKC
jgi:putative N-acetylmannosamine-6-phosphate epimerase